jgi:hypothetical protein
MMHLFSYAYEITGIFMYSAVKICVSNMYLALQRAKLA